ncbi:hypothetical protein V8C26DRAFT_103703 [Trichoderma gracile]
MQGGSRALSRRFWGLILGLLVDVEWCKARLKPKQALWPFLEADQRDGKREKRRIKDIETKEAVECDACRHSAVPWFAVYHKRHHNECISQHQCYQT